MEDKQNAQQLEMLKAENEFLKIKMIAERGANFSTINEQMNVPPEVENNFLKHIIEFEDQHDLNKTIRVFDKIGKPQHFTAENEIPDAEIERAWENLSAHLSDYGIAMSVCSPNVSSRELYRFTVEELFQLEIDNIEIPGMIQGFIYDEFYPDLEYKNSKTAIDDCISGILSNRPLEYTYFMGEENIRLNQYYPLKKEEFKLLINKFKSSFHSIALLKAEHTSVTSTEKTCMVAGVYEATATFDSQMVHLKGKWTVELELTGTYPDWYITNVQIEGFDF